MSEKEQNKKSKQKDFLNQLADWISDKLHLDKKSNTGLYLALVFEFLLLLLASYLIGKFIFKDPFEPVNTIAVAAAITVALGIYAFRDKKKYDQEDQK